MNFDAEPPPRLLVVDDDPLFANFVCHQLAVAGMCSTQAASGAAAWVCLAAGDFDLILLDVGLPDQDGYAWCREFKADPRYGWLPVIFLTARGSESEVLRGFDVGGVDYLVKPFELRVLIARVTTHTTLARLSRGLQATLEARTESLRLAHRRMREMDAELSLAQERERRCLAERLHDSTIQQLVLARMLADPAPRAAVAGCGGAAFGSGPERMERLRALLDLSLAQLRDLVFDLSPPILYQGGLVPALQWLAADFSSRWPVRFACRVEGAVPAIPDDLKVTLFRAVRELMTNVCKHAQAGRAEVLVRGAPQAAELVVSDDGIGIDPALPDHPSRGLTRGGFGLFSVRSRIELIGGRLSLRVGAGGGTQASLWVPLAGAGTAADPRSGPRSDPRQGANSRGRGVERVSVVRDEESCR